MAFHTDCDRGDNLFAQRWCAAHRQYHSYYGMIMQICQKSVFSSVSVIAFANEKQRLSNGFAVVAIQSVIAVSRNTVPVSDCSQP